MIFIGMIVAIVAAIIYYFFFMQSGRISGSLKEFHPNDLREYDGETRKEVYVGCKGLVFDVSKSSNYKPGGNYHIFAGKDATVALAKMSLDAKDLETNDTSNLKETELKCLDSWFNQFKNTYKYPIVGKIVNSGKNS